MTVHTHILGSTESCPLSHVVFGLVAVAAFWVVGPFLLILTLTYDIAVGLDCYAIVAKPSSTGRIVLALCHSSLLRVTPEPLPPARLTNFSILSAYGLRRPWSHQECLRPAELTTG